MVHAGDLGAARFVVTLLLIRSAISRIVVVVCQLGGFVRIDDSVRDGCYCRCNEALSWLTGVVRY